MLRWTGIKLAGAEEIDRTAPAALPRARARSKRHGARSQGKAETVLAGGAASGRAGRAERANARRKCRGEAGAGRAEGPDAGRRTHPQALRLRPQQHQARLPHLDPQQSQDPALRAPMLRWRERERRRRLRLRLRSGRDINDKHCRNHLLRSMPQRHVPIVEVASDGLGSW